MGRRGPYNNYLYCFGGSRTGKDLFFLFVLFFMEGGGLIIIAYTVFFLGGVLIIGTVKHTPKKNYSNY